MLIANRGEIAVRVIRAARELGIESVAVYSEPDQGALHVRLADQKVALGGSAVKDSYLNLNKIINAAVQSGADAVHPGYGLFSENPDFGEAVEKAGLIFVGPRPESVRLMADKEQARNCVKKFDVPIVPGVDAGLSVEELIKAAGKIGYPVLLKAVAGGGGRGMRVVRNDSEIKSQLELAQKEAQAAFGNSAVFLEKYLEKPRHIEVQVFGDEHGNLLHFGERECSLQRRHQKIVEEAPAPRLHPDVRARICEAALGAARSVNYRGAGTVEFLVSGGETKDSPFYFLEMNTRIQVEHPVTEEVFGVDLVKLQIKVAEGEKLPFAQKDVIAKKHSIEFRINAENPAANFTPATGKLRYVSRAGGPGVRDESWVESGSVISPYYDSLLSKVIVTADTRELAIERARRVLDEYLVEGVPTTLQFHRWLLSQPDFKNGLVDVHWIEREYKGQSQEAKTVGPFKVELPQ